MPLFSPVLVALALFSSAAEPAHGSFAPDHPIRRTPTLIARDLSALPKAEAIGSPEVRTLLGYTRRPLHLPDGHTMALFSFSFSAPANWLFLIDCRTMSVERFALPNNDIGSHGAALGADGNIYVMSYGTGNAYCFDVAKREFTELACDIPEGQYAWDALGGKNGRIYFGTYPGAWFGEYDPATAKWEIWKQPVPDTKYVGETSALPDGRITFRANGPADVRIVFDPETRQFAPFDPASVATPQVASPALPPQTDPEDSFETPVEVDGRWFTVSRVSSRLMELSHDAEAKVAGELKSKAETLWWLKAQPGAISGVSYYGALFRYDLATGELRQGQLDNLAPGGNSIMFVETITPECIVGANYSQQNLFTVNPRSGEVRAELGKIARVPGEAMCAVGLDGIAYLGIYVQTVISRFDPARPIVYGENPKELAQFGPEYKQTRPRAAVTDGKLVYISSDSDYNQLGGALIVHDPGSGKFDVYHHLIKDQNLPTLAWDTEQKLLWGGTDRWGQMRSAPPTQESALIYAFNPETREVVETIIPWPGADMVTLHGITRDGVLLATQGANVACIDTKTREVLFQGAWPAELGNGAVPTHLRRGSDGFSYFVRGGTMYRWDSAANTLEPTATAPDANMLTESEPGLWVLSSATTIYRLRLGN